MQVVAADVGNSTVKFIVGNVSTDWTECAANWPACRSLTIAQLQEPEPLVNEPAAWFVSSVNHANLMLLHERAVNTGSIASWHVVQRQEIPLTVDLDQPDSVGVDRLLAALAAHRLYGQEHDVIVVDCGTAMTIDLIGKHATFRGGVIMAGPATNLAALNTMTAALPDLSNEKLEKPISVLGRSTRQAMLSGAWHSGLGAIKEVIAEMEKLTNGKSRVVGTGGGLGPWREVLPATWVLVDDLVLNGIFQVALELARESANERG